MFLFVLSSKKTVVRLHQFAVQEKLWARHKRQSEDLWKGLEKMGLEPFCENPDDRLLTVNTIKVRRFETHLTLSHRRMQYVHPVNSQHVFIFFSVDRLQYPLSLRTLLVQKLAAIPICCSRRRL